jgi:hypothetical protein
MENTKEIVIEGVAIVFIKQEGSEKYSLVIREGFEDFPLNVSIDFDDFKHLQVWKVN